MITAESETPAALPDPASVDNTQSKDDARRPNYDRTNHIAQEDYHATAARDRVQYDRIGRQSSRRWPRQISPLFGTRGKATGGCH
jgi:hypothetical protein